MIFRRVSWSSMSAVPWAAISRLDRRQRPLLLLRAIAAVWRTPYGQRPCGAHRDPPPALKARALPPKNGLRLNDLRRTDQPSLDAFIDSHFEIRSAKPPPGVATSRDINDDTVSLSRSEIHSGNRSHEPNHPGLAPLTRRSKRNRS